MDPSEDALNIFKEASKISVTQSLNLFGQTQPHRKNFFLQNLKEYSRKVPSTTCTFLLFSVFSECQLRLYSLGMRNWFIAMSQHEMEVFKPQV